jgi:protein-L-isoaspartate(D-aspartate) O-methyltransferase
MVNIKADVSGLSFLICIASIVILCARCESKDAASPGFNQKREFMVKNQIEARGITGGKVLEAMRIVERHRFVPEAHQSKAYEDYPLPIGEGQTISQPYIVALMTEVLALDKSKKVLEIGTGSGYQAAILAEICDSVYTIEIVEPLGKRAKKLLEELNYSNVEVKIGDGYKGWSEHSPFDAIIVTCAPSHIPEPLKDQLAEGGRMIIPVGEIFDQKLVLLAKENGKIKEIDVIPVRFVPMIKKNGTGY